MIFERLCIGSSVREKTAVARGALVSDESNRSLLGIVVYQPWCMIHDVSQCNHGLDVSRALTSPPTLLQLLVVVKTP